MQINESKQLNIVVQFSKSLMLITVLGVLVLALQSPILAVLLGGESSVQAQAAPAAMQPAAPTTTTPDASAMEDARSEGQDVLILDAAASPDDLWEGLYDAGFRGDPMDGHERFYVPVGTAVATGHGFYLATLDGWSVCDGGDTSRVCTLQPIDIAPSPVSDEGSTAAPDKSTPAMTLVSYATAAPKSSCATVGNHICGPRNSNGLAPGCYDRGRLVIPWTRYDRPSQDPLWRQFTSPCRGMAK